MPTIALQDIEIYYERSGAGPPLLLLNGSGSTIEGSGPVLSMFRERFDLVTFDQRGLGRTTIPTGQPTMADYAADAVAVADHVGWDRFAVIGLSFGGMVAQELAVTDPDRVARLALVSTSPGGEFPSYPLHELDELPTGRRIETERFLLDSRFTDEWLDAHPIDRFITDALGQRAADPRSAEQQRGEALQLEARRHHDVLARLPRISCPTLVACGAFDGIAPPVNGRAIVERVPGAELRTFDGGHVIFLFQDPSAGPEIAGFLAA